MTGDPLDPSRVELDAARLLTEGGFHPQAISRAYYAAFRAAKAALEELGETRSKHGGVISAFIQVLIKEEGLERQTGKDLRSLFERRNDADYGYGLATSEAAARAIGDAERVVDAVAGGLARRGDPRGGRSARAGLRKGDAGSGR